MDTMIELADLQQKNPWWENAAFIEEDRQCFFLLFLQIQLRAQ
ncbi:MAG: hypothetical protein QME05_06895 [Candidatus Margulisbacteria bacterium]|nr:hypothetical protein [Candidatus Margulisiibacteriota bacterium]